ncbi:MAG: Helicase associated domain protein [Sphingopyxis sp.]
MQNDPEWVTQVDQVWLWDEWPQRWGADCGIDLVFRHKNGEHWAVQAKCYSPDYDISKHDVDKFLSESNRPLIQHRLLIATTDGIGANAKQVCDAQDKPVIRFLLSDFDKSALEYPADFASLPQAKRKPRPTPNDGNHDHQLEAIAAVSQGLQTADRGQLIMACGTGKTYITLWIKEALKAQRTLVLIPSLGLLSQLLREWTFAAATPFEVLCVCSDQTVGSKGSDEAIHSVADLAFPVTSDAEEVKRFLSGAGNRVVFSTYQSSSVIAAAQSDPTIPAFDLAVADEAHRCAGKVGSDFTTILDNTQGKDKIRSVKRLFATATPRTYSSTVHKAAEDRGVEVVGMDNAELFGEVLYALPFGKAIERKLLTDYRVVIIGVDDPTIAQWIANRELVSLSPPRPQGEAWPVLSLSKEGEGAFHNKKGQLAPTRETDSESLAAQIGLLKAIKDYDLKRIISFHSRVKRAEEFTTDMQNTMQWISDEHRPSGTLRTDFVSGNMPANKRKIKLDQLKALNANERGVLSNARCLSEGVDVPSLDGVAFIDPRSSQVDIIQAVGRAIRLSADKKMGTIVLPVFIKAGEDAASTIEASNFKPIWDVLNALKAHDDVLACELDQIRTEMGRKSGSAFKPSDLNKIAIDLPATIDANFSSALRTYLVEQVTESWDERYGQLIIYKQTYGNCSVPAKWNQNRYLAAWVATQRKHYGEGRLSPDRTKCLEVLGFNLEPFASKWDEMFAALSAYKQTYGDCNVPAQWINMPELGTWCSTQRYTYAKNLLSKKRIERLEEIGFVWDLIDAAWEEMFAALVTYKRSYGNCMVSKQWSQNPALATWVNKNRMDYRKGEIALERSKRLHDLGFEWEPNTSNWDELFVALSTYKQKHGDCNVPHGWADNPKLGKWCSHQRQAYKKDILPENRITRLEELGFAWNPLDATWDEMFLALKAYKQTYGDCYVTKKWKDNPELGEWCQRQRNVYKKNKLSPDRYSRLEGIDFVWDPLVENWEEMFSALVNYKQTHGDFKVPKKYDESPTLGVWCQLQRSAYKSNKLSPERIRRFDDIGFEWNPLEAGWEKMFAALVAYKQAHGNCNVPTEWDPNLKLGQWCYVLRRSYRKSTLSADHIKRLEEVGFEWERIAPKVESD